MSSARDVLDGAKGKAKTFFDYGNDALMKNNFDYAIQMYTEACKLDPESLMYRQALRGAERRKFGNEPSKVGRLVGARTQPIRLRARGAKSKGHYAQAIEICEEAFAHNPWDVAAARDAAEAAEQLGWRELAQWLLESVQILVANDVEFYRYLAHISELNQSWAKAIGAWERVKKINPNDEDANRQINALSASATIHRAKLDDALSKKAETVVTSKLDSEMEEMKQPKVSPEERLKREIKENPTMVGPYLQLTEMFKARGQLDNAERLLAIGLKQVADDPSLQLAYAEVQIARLQRAIASYTEKLKANPDDVETKAKLEQLQAKRDEYEVNEFRRRIRLYPGDMKLHYELGARLARAGRHGEAIGEFQQALTSPALKVQALYQLGQSFEAEGRHKLAERNYEEAIMALDPNDRTTFHALHYRLGRVYEATGNTQAAEEHYNEVAANDYGYLDVAQRLRGLS
jgi:tetratricopeptide (TPR) repeat protein